MAPHPSFFTTFSPLAPVLVHGITAAYENAIEGLNVGHGARERHLGYQLRDYIRTQFDMSSADRRGFEIHERNNALVATAGDWEFGWWRVALSERDDIWKSFPLNNKTAPAMVDQHQLDLFPAMSVEPDLSASRKVVLAHRGNLDGGCRAIDLCFPTGTSERTGLINQWGYVHDVWRAPADELAAAIESAAAEPPPAVEDDDLEFTARRSKKRDPGR